MILFRWTKEKKEADQEMLNKVGRDNSNFHIIRTNEMV